MKKEPSKRFMIVALVITISAMTYTAFSTIASAQMFGPTSVTRPLSITNMVLMTSIVVSTADGSEREINVDVPLLTVCTVEQYDRATTWQKACRDSDGVRGEYCPILSYQRFCEPATVEDVEGLTPAQEHYRNTYMAE